MAQAPRRIEIAPVIDATIAIYRWAVYLSFAFLGVGFVAALFSDHPTETEIGTPRDMLRNMLDLHPAGFFGVGIGIMILAPIVMLFEAALILHRKGDRRYALFTLTVALILSLSILIAFLRG